jgi:hypothetical protein
MDPNPPVYLATHPSVQLKLHGTNFAKAERTQVHAGGGAFLTEGTEDQPKPGALSCF